MFCLTIVDITIAQTVLWTNFEFWYSNLDFKTSLIFVFIFFFLPLFFEGVGQEVEGSKTKYTMWPEKWHFVLSCSVHPCIITLPFLFIFKCVWKCIHIFMQFVSLLCDVFACVHGAVWLSEGGVQNIHILSVKGMSWMNSLLPLIMEKYSVFYTQNIFTIK